MMHMLRARGCEVHILTFARLGSTCQSWKSEDFNVSSIQDVHVGCAPTTHAHETSSYTFATSTARRILEHTKGSTTTRLHQHSFGAVFRIHLHDGHAHAHSLKLSMNFFANKPGTGDNKASPAKKPVIKKSIVQVPVANAAARRPDPNRFKLSATTISARPPKPVQRALASSRGAKRKSATPDVHFSSDDEVDSGSSDIGNSDSDASRKRVKSSVSSVESLRGPRRPLVLQKAYSASTSPLPLVQGVHLTTGKYASKYGNPWDQESFSAVRLQYPCTFPRERFELRWPKNDKEDYKPMDDIRTTIQTVATFYFPEALSKQYTSIDSGFTTRFNHAYARGDIPEWLHIVDEYNAVLRGLVNDGTVQRELSQRTTLHLDHITRILDQIYARTVSPNVDSLNQYKVGSDNVYGELLPRLVSDIFAKTSLTHEQVFIDLGSGVGNVVLQAALEVGCESWGIEMMPNPCELAELQAQEFAARTQLWGIQTGEMHLLRGDMTSHPQVPGLLQRADVVLVNNQAFTPALNDTLRDMFLDLKPGARVVSLKPFVPEGHKIQTRNVDSVVNQFVQKKFEYFSDSVSWSHNGNAHWYIATKDLRPLHLFRKKHGLDGN